MARVTAYFKATRAEPQVALGDQERAEVEDFLFDRYAIASTPEEAAERVLRAVDETGIRRIFIALISDDMERVFGLATSRMLPRLLV